MTDVIRTRRAFHLLVTGYHMGESLNYVIEIEVYVVTVVYAGKGCEKTSSIYYYGLLHWRRAYLDIYVVVFELLNVAV